MILDKLAKLNNKKKIIISLFLFSLLFFITRLSFINYDTINPDGVNWHNRSQQFVNGIKYFQFEKTYQHYHPGVTLMWISGFAIELTKFVINQEVYNHLNFEIFDTVVKVNLIFFQFILTLITIYLFSKITSYFKAISIVSLFTFETFFTGNSRLLHLDTLSSLLIINSLLLFYILINNIDLIKNKYNKTFTIILTSLFFALSFLTKSIAIGLVPFSVLVTLIYFVYDKLEKSSKVNQKLNFKKYFIKISLVLSLFLFFVFLLFPALWVKPIYYITEIFSEGERVGIRKGHEQIVFGEQTNSAGFMFYILVLLIKVTPFSIITILTALLIFIKNNFFKLKDIIIKNIKSLDLYLILFYATYYLVMNFPTKKIDRYMIIMFPFIGYLVFKSLVYIFNNFKKYDMYLKNIFGITFILTFAIPMITFYPYYFTYFSPIFINAQNAHNIVAQKPFGIGMYELRDLIIKDYSEVNLGFIDVKPIESIYPASKVFDIRVMDTSKYDILILGPNEEMPKKVLDSEEEFILDQIFKINSLDYWYIYVKNNK